MLVLYSGYKSKTVNFNFTQKCASLLAVVSFISAIALPILQKRYHFLKFDSNLQNYLFAILAPSSFLFLALAIIFAEYKAQKQAESIIPQEDNIDCTNLEVACRVLGLTEEEAKNIETLRTRYANIFSRYQTSIQRASLSPFIQGKLKKLQGNATASYNTLIQEFHTNS